VEQFELIKSDWQMEKESLEDALMKLRQELKTREEKLNALHVSKVIHCLSAGFVWFVIKLKMNCNLYMHIYRKVPENNDIFFYFFWLGIIHTTVFSAFRQQQLNT